MEKQRGRLKAKEEYAKIGTKKEEGFFYDGRESRKRVYKRWYAVYLATVAVLLASVILLMTFGVNNNGENIGGNFFGGIADKVVGWFAELSFPFNEQTGSSAEVYGDKTDTVNGTVNKAEDESQDNPSVGEVVKGLYDFDYSEVPEGHTPIIPMDLSLSKYGDTYINNSTGYSPDTVTLLTKKLSNGYTQLSSATGPLVLIIHTHGTEAYSEEGAISYPSDSPNYARTSDTRKNVVAVGKALAQTLIENGIPTAHCTTLHDSVQYKDSYARAEETIKKYLSEYPTIKLIIDVHRDSITKSSGEMVRPVTEVNGEAAAQVMCVVGSDWEGDVCPAWQDNLSLALKLRQNMNSQYQNICRPPFLKGHTYNQEIAPYSLLLEIGSEGNSLEEAILSAELVGESLSKLVNEI